MEISLAIWIVLMLFFAFMAVRQERSNRKRKKINAIVDKRQTEIEYRINLSVSLFQCFLETKDVDYIKYSEEEISKAEELIRLNEADLKNIK